MIVDFRKKDNVILPLAINQDDIEMVSKYKYLGTHIEKDFSWDTNTQTIVSKVNQRLYLLRKLKTCNIRKETLLLFYDSIRSSNQLSPSPVLSGSLVLPLKTK